MIDARPDRSVVSWIVCLIVAAAINVGAAVAPRSPDELRGEATHIVSGTVVEVTSKTQKSEIEKAVGIHRDRIYTIRLRVTAVSKGAGVKAGDLIEVVAWRPSCRIPPMPGPQGHGSIPKKGEAIKVHMVSEAGGVFEPLLPNGIAIEKGAGS